MLFQSHTCGLLLWLIDLLTSATKKKELQNQFRDYLPSDQSPELYLNIFFEIRTGRMSGVLESSLVAGFSNLRLFALRVFCSSVTWDTPRRRIHQKFTLTSLSSLLFYLFHLLFRLKTLDRSIDFLALPSSSSIKLCVYW